jgi:hypothetical protein
MTRNMKNPFDDNLARHTTDDDPKITGQIEESLVLQERDYDCEEESFQTSTPTSSRNVPNALTT